MPMSERILPRYPIYIPSKGRSHACQTVRCLLKHDTPFSLVVEPQEEAVYRAQFPTAPILLLPWNGDDETRRAFCRQLGIENGGLIAARNWIKAHAISRGVERHWQLDDNMDYFRRYYRQKRLYCESGIALRVCEDFTDRYENVALSGLNYEGFLPDGVKRVPFVANCHVYSCTLILNSLPFRWRLAYNDDTDMCLQVLSGGWCTILLNSFVVHKIQTMKVRGGNTDALYHGDGRLTMARSLERMWPGVVTTQRRYHRPQHVVKDSWKRFTTPLKLKPGIAITSSPNEYGMSLVQVASQIKSPRIQALHDDWHQTQATTERQDYATHSE
jgi:hypothetical protein